MKIAYIGQKGIPATFGGIEYHVDELASRLAARGHSVSVYVRNWYTSPDLKEHHSVQLVHTPTIKTKHLDAFIHSFSSSLNSLFQSYDIVHYHGIGPCFFSWFPKLRGKGIVATIHGFDYDAAKWNRGARYFLKTCEKIALTVPHRTIVVAKHQRDFYQSQGYDVTYIPNGVPLPELIGPQEIIRKYGLKGGDYILFLGRLVPEKRVDWLLDSYLKANLEDVKLVIAGGSSATDEYVAMLRRQANQNPNIIFTGYVTGRLKAELFSNACFFVIPSALEGLPIALLEAMSYKLPCLASDIPPHKEVITHSRNGFLFGRDNQNNLTQAILKLASLDNNALSNIGETARYFVAKNYDWDDVVEQVEDVYENLTRK